MPLSTTTNAYSVKHSLLTSEEKRANLSGRKRETTYRRYYGTGVCLFAAWNRLRFFLLIKQTGDFANRMDRLKEMYLVEVSDYVRLVMTSGRLALGIAAWGVVMITSPTNTSKEQARRYISVGNLAPSK